jgi:hypothetical protein
MTNLNQGPRQKKIWRGAMVGAGAWSEPQLAAWNGVKNACIVERRRPVVSRIRVGQEFDDVEAMLDQSNLDFVDIRTMALVYACYASAEENGVVRL